MADDDAVGGALSGAASGASAGAMFGPWGAVIGAGIGIAGSFLKAKGTLDAVSATKEYANRSNQIAAQQTAISGQKNQITSQNVGLELGIEQQRRNAMEINAQRQSLEQTRNMNRALSAGRAAAANSGALFGSGVEGGKGQIQGQSGFNQLGIAQGLDIGENVFGLNAQISQNKIGLGNLQYQSDVLGYQQQLAKNQYAVSQSTAQGTSSFGGSLISAAGPLSNLLSGFKK